MAKAFLVYLLFLVIGGCVTADEYTQHLRKQFVGKSIDTAVNEYGPPTVSAKYQDGKAYEWTRTMGHRGISSDSGMSYAPAALVERSCTWRVITDKNGVITQAGWQGNACYNQLQPLPK